MFASLIRACRFLLFRPLPGGQDLDAAACPAPLVHTSPQARIALWIFLSFTTFYVGITRGHFVGTDEMQVYQTTRSLWEEGNLSTSPINGTTLGRHGRYYSGVNAGLPVAALPLYGLGKFLGRSLDRAGRKDWIETFAGPIIGDSEWRWGGEIEIFFVNLFNCFATALLCALFYAFNLRLGASPRWSVASTTLLGLTSFVGPFATGLLQHTSEALLLLWAFYFLFLDAQRPDWRSRAWAGVAVAGMLQCRFPSLMALPALGLYLVWNLWQRRGSAWDSFPQRAIGEMLPFATPVAAGIVLHVAVNYLKFETISLTGLYSQSHFTTQLLAGLYGLLLSPGESIFLYTPLLLLAPWTARHLFREHRAEALFILLLSGSYLVICGSYEYWHGLWSSLGPRYLIPLVPVLLLPLAGWMERSGTKAWLTVAPLALAGFWAQLVHVAANFSYVSYYEHYFDVQPLYSFLYIPAMAPLLGHSRAVLAGDYRVDMWLVNVYRGFGAGRTLTLLLPITALLAFSVSKLRQNLSREEGAGLPPCVTDFSPYLRNAVALLAAVWLGAGLAMFLDYRDRVAMRAKTDLVVASTTGEDAVMRAGLEELYTRRNPRHAVTLFRRVLEMNPAHYGATFQLARALDGSERPREARFLWQKMLSMAEASHDAETIATVRLRLQKQP